MAIEGPLRELGIHDVFQLLDLSRKTGVLRVVSELREDEGLVVFDGGRVVKAKIRSKALPTELALLEAGRITKAQLERARARAAGRPNVDVAVILVEMGAISQKELDRQLRLHLESVVFELMSWQEGFFSFEERPRDGSPHETRISVSTESLLMEGARRIDEWSRIAEVVPNARVVPELAPVDDSADGNELPTDPDEAGPMLDLLPHEWQVLTMIDGARDLRGIAASLGRDEFEIAKIAYGLATTGVIHLTKPTRASQEISPDLVSSHFHAGYAAARRGEFAAARLSWEHFLTLSPDDDAAQRARDALAALDRFVRVLEDETHG